VSLSFIVLSIAIIYVYHFKSISYNFDLFVLVMVEAFEILFWMVYPVKPLNTSLFPFTAAARALVVEGRFNALLL